MKLSICVPFFNEEENVSTVLRSTLAVLRELGVVFEIIAINNGSTDTTGQIIKNEMSKNDSIRLVNIANNQGYGYGVLQGLHSAKGEFIGWIYGDGQINPNVIKDLFSLIVKHGERGLYKIKRISREDGLNRFVSSKSYNALLKLLFNLETNDVNGCPKLFSRTLFHSLNVESKDWFIDSEILIKAYQRGIPIYETETTFSDRGAGSSNVRLLKTSWELLRNALRFYFH